MPFLTPFLLIPGILTEKWDALETIPMIGKDVPMLLLVGAKDELVVDGQMKGIREKREESGGRCKWVVMENGTHSELWHPRFACWRVR